MNNEGQQIGTVLIMHDGFYSAQSGKSLQTTEREMKTVGYASYKNKVWYNKKDVPICAFFPGKKQFVVVMNDGRIRSFSLLSAVKKFGRDQMPRKGKFFERFFREKFWLFEGIGYLDLIEGKKTIGTAIVVKHMK